MRWRRARTTAATVLPLLAFVGLAYGIRADAGTDLARLWRSLRDNPVLTLFFFASVIFSGIVLWPMIKGWLLIRDDESLRRKVRDWLDKQQYGITTAHADHPQISFLI